MLGPPARGADARRCRLRRRDGQRDRIRPVQLLLHSAEDVTRVRQPLPQLGAEAVFVTDGGLETELVFHDGRDLPCFAAFPLLAQPEGRARLRRYYDGYLDIARRHGDGFIVETPTWRAN